MSTELLTFEPEERGKRCEADENRQPVADRDAAEQDAGAENGPDRGRVGAFHEAPHIGVSAVLRKERGCDQHQNERREKDADRGNERPQKPATR